MERFALSAWKAERLWLRRSTLAESLAAVNGALRSLGLEN